MTINPNLIPYRVSLEEDKGDKFTIHFDCMAEDDDDAITQAENVYPNGDIYLVTPFPSKSEGEA